jgi:predicted aspartyl protease
VLIKAKIENLEDLHMVEGGRIPATQFRMVELTDAVADTSFVRLAMPRKLIEQLGLRHLRTRKVKTDDGVVSFRDYSPARLTVQGRDCITEVTELPDGSPVRLGLTTLGMLDFVIDPVGQRLIGNPAHGGEPMIELY